MGMGRMAVLAAYNCWPGGIRAMPAEREGERASISAYSQFQDTLWWGVYAQLWLNRQ